MKATLLKENEIAIGDNNEIVKYLETSYLKPYCSITSSPLNYIDPGTSSMLFSFFIAIASTLTFAFETLNYKLKRLFFKKDAKDKKRNKFVIYAEEKQYFNVFKGILEEFENRKIEVLYYTSSKDDPCFEQKYEYIKCEFLPKSNKTYFKLSFLSADICLMTTPGLDVYQLKRSKNVKHYSHILHSVDDPSIYRLFNLDYFDSVLLSGEYQKENIRHLERLRYLKHKDLVVVGSTYLDEAYKKVSSLGKKELPPTIVLAPSWGPNALLSKFGQKLIDPLLNSGFKIILRPHPQSLISQTKLVKTLQNRYKDKIEWDLKRDNLETLNKADILISDFSSIIFDFCFLFNRPFLFALNGFNKEILDLSDIEKRPISLEAIYKLGKELEPENFNNIESIIEELLNNQRSFQTEVEHFKQLFWQEQTRAAKNAVDFLVQKQKEVEEC